MHGQLQHPAARLAGRTPRSYVVPLEPFKSNVFKLRRQGPGKRILPGRPTKALQGTCRDAPRAPARQQGPGKRSLPGRLNKVHRGPVSDELLGPAKITTEARRLPRQAATLRPRSSASTNVSLWGPLRACVAGGCAASGVQWHAKLTRSPSWRAVAPLMILFYTVWATQTGI